VSPDLAPGAAVRMELTKWGDQPHWAFDARWLGSDEHGDWLGFPTGTPMARPGAAFTTTVDQVGLVPRADHGAGGAWLPTFHAPGTWCATYVDMTTRPWWDGTTCRAVDLDLDVVLTAEGDVYVDDEDEFADHRVRFGYPPEVVSLAEEASRWVAEAVLHQRAPFDGTSSAPWFERLARLDVRTT
jgi:uncharacterized protein